MSETTTSKKKPSLDKVKAAFDRGIVLKTLQSVYKLAAETNAFKLFANLEAANSDQAYAKYTTSGKSVLSANGYSLAFKFFLFGVDFAQVEYIKPDGSQARLHAINKFFNNTQVEIKIGDDPLRNIMLSDAIDPVPLIVNPLLTSGAMPANIAITPAIIAQPSASLENERNIIRLPQEIINDSKISFEFRSLKGDVGAELANYLVVGKWTLEEQTTRRLK